MDETTVGTNILFRDDSDDRYRTIRGGLAVSAIAAVMKFAAIKDTIIDFDSGKKIAKIARWAENNIDGSIVDAIWSNRVELIVLINSGGGEVLPAECIVSLMEAVKFQGGRVITCASSTAGSAAMQIFGGASDFSYAHAQKSESHKYFPGLPDERIALADTCFLEHEPHGGKTPDHENSGFTAQQRAHLQTIRESGDAITRDLIKNLLQHTVKNTHIQGIIGRIEAARADVQNTLSNAYFRGSELPGFVTSYTNSIAEIQDVVQGITNAHIDPQEWRTNPIARFFKFSRIEEKLRVIGHRDAALTVDRSGQLKVLNIPQKNMTQIAEAVGSWIKTPDE